MAWDLGESERMLMIGPQSLYCQQTQHISALLVLPLSEENCRFVWNMFEGAVFRVSTFKMLSSVLSLSVLRVSILEHLTGYWRQLGSIVC